MQHIDRRLVRENAHLYVRPDAARWLVPGAPDPYKALRNPHHTETALEREQRLADLALGRALIEERKFIGELTAALADLKAELFRRRLRRSLKAYKPEQPRVPAGNPDGGRWTDANGGGALVRLAQATTGSVSDVDGTPYYQPGGHHEFVQEIYKKWDLSPETRKVFDQARTGRIPQGLIRTAPDGEPLGHFWNGRTGAHGVYNEAVKELATEYLERSGLDPNNPKDMTPEQARALLKEIRETQDPRIRVYNDTLRLFRRLFRLRMGRGTE